MRPSFPTWILLPLLACGGGAGKKGEELCDDGTPKKTWYADNDRDGFGNENTATRACSAPEGWILVAGDCDDGRTAVNPDMPEICDEGGVDEDCDGLAGDADAEGAQGALEGYVDADGDGFGELGSELIAVCGYGDGRADNAEDCDDSDASTFPGSAYREDPSLCMEDGDGDGWGNPYPTGNGSPGNDCDDTNPDVFPGAPEILDDGVDQDCDDKDIFGLTDDFELGAPDQATWASAGGAALISTDPVAQGAYALELSASGSDVTTRAVDTTACSQIHWWYLGKRGPERPDTGEFLDLEFDSGGGTWVLVDSWEGGTEDTQFDLRSGIILDPLAYHSGFRVRLNASGGSNGSDHFHVDDFFVGCPGDDNDGDGVPAYFDCDPSSGAHWDDCGACVDADGDDYGTLCNLGSDCDDADASVSPGAPDPLGDGIDTNCDGSDGVRFFDDFEAGVANPSVFAAVNGDADVQSAVVANGSFALRMGGNGGEVITNNLDISACGGARFAWQGKRGPEVPDSGDDVFVEYQTASGWIPATTWAGDGTTDPTFDLIEGFISDPNALWPGFALRMTSRGSGAGTDEFYLDDFVLECFIDDDLDGVGANEDCDDNDPLHWSDCGLCVDVDGDARGEYCDLGSDCDETDPSIYQGAPDPYGDGIDTSCDGFDGVMLMDDFEAGVASAAVFVSVSGDADVQSGYAANGAYALRLGGGIGIAETITVDTSGCSALLWSYEGKRGPDTPETADFMTLEWWNGFTWLQADVWYGNNSTDAAFSNRNGVVTDPVAFHPDFKARLYSDGSGLNTDEFYVDDFMVGCGDTTDSDLDGTIDVFDCDVYDPAHWSDCGLCVDGDGDGFGSACDLGDDCDDLDAAVNPLGVDLGINGADEDCDGLDGAPLLVEDFETGSVNPLVWSTINGDGGIVSTESYAGVYSLDLGGGGAQALTVLVDTTMCVTVGYRYWGKQGPEQPDSTDTLDVSYDYGAGLRVQESWPGGDTSGVWQYRTGQIPDPLAVSAAFQLEFYALGTGSGFDDYYIDDFALGCAP